MKHINKYNETFKHLSVIDKEYIDDNTGYHESMYREFDILHTM